MTENYRMINTSYGEKSNIGIRKNVSLSSVSERILVHENIAKAKSGKYNCFAVSYLFDDLFCGNEYTKFFSKKPLIKLDDSPCGHKGILSFIFPDEILKTIKEKDDKLKLTKEKKNTAIKEDHYAHFLQLKYNDNIITNFIYEVYAKLGWKKFINLIQCHIADQLAEKNLCINQDLIEYLSIVGNETIVPYDTSPKSNEEFLHLIEKGKNGDNQALILVISNFFISSILGLRSLNFPSDTGKGKKPSFKTYLLSCTGMECIWKPDLISPPYERLFDSRRLFENANYRSAIKTIEDWLKEYEQVASNEAKALAYQILGFSLYNLTSSDDKELNSSQSKGTQYLKKCIDTGKADLSVYYSLYDYLKESLMEEATEYLKTAFAHNYAKAVIEVAFLYLNDACIFDEITEELLLKKINYIIENERKNDIVDVGKCLYLRGQFEKKYGNESNANRDFESAAKKGNERARQEISRKKRNERNSFPKFINNKNAPCCYSNTFTDNNYTVASTFPSGTWSMYTPDKTDKEGVNEISGIEEFIDLQYKSGFNHSRFVFLFMSQDEDKNLNECLILLDKLFNFVLSKSEEVIWKIIDLIDIFVSAKYETASMLIDANISDMGDDIYFKVHITDANRDTVHKLLCDVPLFTPALSGLKKEKFTKVVLFGDSEINYSFIKESVACAYLGEKHPIDITLMGENAEVLENRFRQECPGIYKDTPHISCIMPQFIRCNVKEADFPNLIYGKIHDHILDEKKEHSIDAEAVNALLEANYFVVDYSDDLENIKFASELRTWLLRSRGTFDRAPFIAVKCSDEQNSYLARHLTLSGQAAGSSYFNKYDLFPIGISAQTYSYKNIIENPVLNEFALRIHKSYYDGNERKAENDFYSYSYNSDSSLSTAIGLCYRFFSAGIAFKEKDSYLNFRFFNTPNIGSKFEEEYREKLEDLAALEQSRWNGFMLSRGWESASKSEVQAYKEQSTGLAHKHILAKKHPFIREWDALDTSKLSDLLGILKSKFNYDRQPQVTTKKSIEDTSKFFRTKSKEKEKIH